MNFIETRGNDGRRPASVSFSQAILTPMSSFGGLYVPETLPTLGEGFLQAHLGSDYKTLARAVMDAFETDVDDVPPEVLGNLFGKALAEGALDILVLPGIMKKNRPGHRISLLCRPADRGRLARLLLEETGSLGVRLTEVERVVLPREEVERDTSFGPMRFKKAVLPGGRIRLTPEFDECAAVARKRGIPLLHVWEQALQEVKGEK